MRRNIVKIIIVGAAVTAWMFSGIGKVFNFPPDIGQAQAAISAVTARGSSTTGTGNSNSHSGSPNANITVGKIFFVAVTTDNEGTTDGCTGDLHQISDTKGNAWTKILECVETDGAGDDGNATSLFATKVTTQINTSDTITVNFDSSRSDVIMSFLEATFDAGNTFAVEQIGVGQNLLSASVSGMPSREYLLIGLLGAEGEDTTKTPGTNYTERHDLVSTTAGQSDTNVQQHVQTRVATLTSDTVSTSAITHTNSIQLLIAIYQVAPAITVSGTSDLSSGTVRVAVDSSLQTQTGSISGGSWTISGVTPPAAGAVVTVWVDGALDTNESTAVTKYDGSGNITGMVLNQHVLSIGSGDNQSLTVTNLGQYDNDQDEDVMHSANSSVLNVDDDNVYADEKIRILSGTTLTIAGSETLTTHDIRIDGILTSSGAGIFNVTGSWDNNNDFNSATETINFTSGSTETIDSTGAIDADVNKIVFNDSGGQWTLSSALTVNDDVTVTAGTLTGSQSVTVGGGDVTGNGIINLTGGTFTLNGTGSFGGDTAWTFSSLTFGGTASASGSGGITVSSVLTVSGSLDAGSLTWRLTGAGTPFASGGTFTSSNSTVSFEATSGIVTVTPRSYYNLQFSPSSGTPTFRLGAGTFLIGNNFSTSGAGDPVVDVNTNDPGIEITGSFTLAVGDTFQASNSATTTIAGNFTNSGTFTHNSGTVKFKGAVNATSTITGVTTFYNLFSTSTSHHLAFTNGTTFQINGTFTVIGQSGALSNIFSSSVGSQWTLNLQGTSNIHYTNVRDSACHVSSLGINLTDGTSTDSGNNGNCWSFPGSAVTLSSANNSIFVFNGGNQPNQTITITANQGFQITSGNGIRIKIPSGFGMGWLTSDTSATFGGTASSKIAGTAAFSGVDTLVVDVTSNFFKGETLTIADLQFTNFSATANDNLELYLDGPADVTVDATDDKTVGVSGASNTASAAAIASNQLNVTGTSVTNVPLYTFALQPADPFGAGEQVSVTQIILRLENISTIVQSDFTNLRLYRDNNSDGLVDGGDTQVGGSGAVVVSGADGTITFSSSFSVTANTNFVVEGSVSNIQVQGDGFKIRLYGSDINASGATTGFTINHSSDVSLVKHFKKSNHAGGNPGSGGEPPGQVKKGGDPDGGTDPTGGGDGGGGSEGGGEEGGGTTPSP